MSKEIKTVEITVGESVFCKTEDVVCIKYHNENSKSVKVDVIEGSKFVVLSADSDTCTCVIRAIATSTKNDNLETEVRLFNIPIKDIETRLRNSGFIKLMEVFDDLDAKTESKKLDEFLGLTWEDTEE